MLVYVFNFDLFGLEKGLLTSLLTLSKQLVMSQLIVDQCMWVD